MRHLTTWPSDHWAKRPQGRSIISLKLIMLKYFSVPFTLFEPYGAVFIMNSKIHLRKNSSNEYFKTISHYFRQCFNVHSRAPLVRKQINVIHVLQVHQATQSGQMANVIRLCKFAIASVYLYAIFLLCYLPNTCVLLTIASSGPSTCLRHLQFFTMTLVFLNSTLNPLIYCWKMKHIRHTVVDMLRHTFSSLTHPTEES